MTQPRTPRTLRHPVPSRSHSARRRAPLIVITGGAGAGKTSVARVFRGCGARVVEVDRLARRLLAPGAPAWRDVLRVFCGARLRAPGARRTRYEPGDFTDRSGRPFPELPWAITSSGAIRRARLGATVFSDRALLAALDRITHPRLRRLLDRLVRAHRAAGVRPLVLDMAVYPEPAFRGLADAVLWVRSPVRVRIRRLAAGRGWSRAEAGALIRRQWPDRRFRALADRVLSNPGSAADLRRRARALWPDLLARAGRACTGKGSGTC